MTLNVKFHAPVVTRDGEMLGAAQRIYTNEDETELETQTKQQHLKVFNFEIGDVYYIPTEYLIASKDGVEVTLNYQTVLDRSYSRLPRYIAYEVGAATELEK